MISGVWSGAGLHRFLRPERELTQMVRVTRPGATVAGLSLVRGGPAIYDAALRLGASYLPGLRGLTDGGPVRYPATHRGRPLEAGMVLSIETDMKIDGLGFVKLEDTVASFERVVAGEFDNLPEQAFYMVGGIEEVTAQAQRLAAI